MGKSTGFMEFGREKAVDRMPLERIKDWHSIHQPLVEFSLHQQSARCMDCGIPFCHTGKIINGMTSGCPINNLIPEWNDLVYQGLWREAYDRLEKTNNFPEFTGLVCPAPCEAACTLGINTPPVTIKNIEQAIIEKAFAERWVWPEMPAKRTGKKVAVVGSGPAGLACADQLNRVGHEVTVFERANRIGGLLMYGIPNMKLEKEIVQRRVDLLMAVGITFRTNTEVGVDYPVEDLKANFDAVVLCIGSTRPRGLTFEGHQSQGIHFAMDYLTANTRQLLGDNLNGDFISAAGKDVIVIGGGDTGTDCVGTALRHGCRTLVQFEIMPQPPEDRAPDNPWPQWPVVHKLDYGQEEAEAIYGRDPRCYSILTKRFVSDEQGQLEAVETVDVVWEAANGSGRPSLKELPGTERRWPAQLVLLAMGFLGPEAQLLEKLDLERDERSNVKADYGKFATNVPGVFAAGDGRRGQSLVVWAINEGRGAARECDRFLMGETNLL